MADSATIKVVEETSDFIVVHLTGISDGTGEAAAIKVDKSTLFAAGGAEPVSLDFLEARWSVQGYTSVRFFWDHTTDELALICAGSGYDDYRNDDGVVSSRRRSDGLRDGRGAGGTGDILLTSVGFDAGDTYDITLRLRKTVA